MVCPVSVQARALARAYLGGRGQVQLPRVIQTRGQDLNIECLSFIPSMDRTWTRFWVSFECRPQNTIFHIQVPTPFLATPFFVAGRVSGRPGPLRLA